MSTKTSGTTEDRTVTSADGSTIAYDLSGSGRNVILIAPALADRKDHRRLAALLAKSHTVINHDRRGRGGSSEASPWSVEREVDDIAALMDAHGGSAALFGASSGAVLALEAANTLADKVEKVVSFEAPVIVDGGRPPVPHDLPQHLGQLVRAGRRSKAVSTFTKEALNSPAAMTIAMRLMVPVWRQMTAMAQTAEYDVALCRGLQDGLPIPDGRWLEISAPALVLVGEKSPRWAHTSAGAVADRLGARLEVLPQAHHGSPTMQPQVIVPQLGNFLRSN